MYHHVSGQQSSVVIGSRSASLGNTSACVQDVWSVFSNPASIATLKETQVGFTYESLLQFAPFNRMAAAAIVPAKIGVIGAGVYKFGDDLYSEQIITTSYANKFGMASLGVKANLVQYAIEGYGRKQVFTVSMGGLAQLTPWLSVGAYIMNINQPKTESGQRVPTRLYAGVGITPASSCFITAEVEKDIDYAPTLKAGIEYEINKKLIIRTGFNIYPYAGFAGLGFRPTRFQFDYAFGFNPALGTRHQGSVLYKIKKH